MSKSKALIIVTISVEPHTPASRVTLEVAHAGRDTEEILSALVVEKFRELNAARPKSVLPGVHYDAVGNAVDTLGNKLKSKRRRARTSGGSSAS